MNESDKRIVWGSGEEDPSGFKDEFYVALGGWAMKKKIVAKEFAKMANDRSPSSLPIA